MKKFIKLLITIIYILSCGYGLYTLNKFGMLPNRYMLYITEGMILAYAICLFLIKRKKLFINVLGILLLMVGSVCSLVSSSFIGKADDTIKKIVSNKTTSVEYSLIAKKDSKYKDIDDFDGEFIGYLEDENSKDLMEMIKYDVPTNFTKYEDNFRFLDDFMNQGKPIVLNSDYKEALDDEVEGFKDSYRVIKTYNVKENIKIDLNKKEVEELTKKPFIVYISGIDTYGKITTRSRSDVNQLVVVNPKTHHVLLVNTPRDYYVQLHGTYGTKDKLTHAGIYGINKSIATMEDIYGIKIDNYLRINFDSLIKIVDAIGGIEINSDLTFSRDGCNYKKGNNHLDGKCALRYARERKIYQDGDHHRGRNQQQVITAIIDKVSTSTEILKNYDKIMETLSGSFETSASEKEIKAFVKKQLTEKAKWDVESIQVVGDGAYRTTYSMGPSWNLWVMIPDQISVNNAKNRINDVLGE